MYVFSGSKNLKRRDIVYTIQCLGHNKKEAPVWLSVTCPVVCLDFDRDKKTKSCAGFKKGDAIIRR